MDIPKPHTFMHSIMIFALHRWIYTKSKHTCDSTSVSRQHTAARERNFSKYIYIFPIIIVTKPEGKSFRLQQLYWFCWVWWNYPIPQTKTLLLKITFPSLVQFALHQSKWTVQSNSSWTGEPIRVAHYELTSSSNSIPSRQRIKRWNLN